MWTDLSIAVPWGIIAGKIWGDTKGKLVLAVHGRQDNCAVYDRLISLLVGQYYIVAIDLPGHGLSSHFPSGMYVDYFNYVAAIKRVVDHLKWRQFYYVGHSLGGQLGITFNSFFPSYVKKFVLIDHVGPLYVPDEAVFQFLKLEMEDFFKIEDRVRCGEPPVYTYEEALGKLMPRLTAEAAKIVLTRSLTKYKHGYTFRMDQRLKLEMWAHMNEVTVQQIIKALKCPVLLLLSTERFQTYAYQFYNSLRIYESMGNVTMKKVLGDHDVHQNAPERVADAIDAFLTLEQSKL